MTLEQIRDRIERDRFGKLLPSEIVETMQEIKYFLTTHHYLPNDIDEWYDSMHDIYMEEQENEYNAFMEQGGDWEG